MWATVRVVLVGDGSQQRVVDEFGRDDHRALDQVADGIGVLGQTVEDACHVPLCGALHQCLHEALASRELTVNTAARIAGLLRDHVHRRRPVAAGREQPLGRIEERFLRLLGRDPAARRATATTTHPSDGTRAAP
jgi:hypothetical protein